MSGRDWAFVPRLEPSDARFWNDYTSPTTFVGRLVQYPWRSIDANSLADAYMRDWRAARRPTVERDDG